MGLPSVQDVFKLLEEYNIENQVSNEWVSNKMTNFVIPWIERKTKMSLSSVQTVTEYYDGNGGDLLILRRRPIVDLLAINYTNVPSNQFFISPMALQIIADEGILKAKSNFNESNYTPIFMRGTRNLRITYSYGFTDCPAPIKHAIECLTAEKVLGHIANRTGGGNLSVSSFSRQWGNRGKFTEARNELARDGMSALRQYMTGVTA